MIHVLLKMILSTSYVYKTLCLTNCCNFFILFLDSVTIKLATFSLFIYIFALVFYNICLDMFFTYNFKCSLIFFKLMLFLNSRKCALFTRQFFLIDEWTCKRFFFQHSFFWYYIYILINNNNITK